MRHSKSRIPTGSMVVSAAIIAVCIHAARYLPESFTLFVVVVLGRTIFASVVAVSSVLVMLLVIRLRGKTSRPGLLQNVAAGVFALTAVLMIAASLGNPYPDGLLNLFLLDLD